MTYIPITMSSQTVLSKVVDTLDHMQGSVPNKAADYAQVRAPSSHLALKWHSLWHWFPQYSCVYSCVFVLYMKSYLFFNENFHTIYSNHILIPSTSLSFLSLLLPSQHYVLSIRNKIQQNKTNPPTRKHVNETHNIQIDKRAGKQINAKTNQTRSP